MEGGNADTLRILLCWHELWCNWRLSHPKLSKQVGIYFFSMTSSPYGGPPCSFFVEKLSFSRSASG